MSQNTNNTKFPSFDRGVSPVWAQLLYKGVGSRDKIKEGIETVKADKDLLWQGLLGKSFLDRVINPGFKKLLPDSTKLDVLKQEFKYSPTKKLDLTLGKRGDDTKFGLNWRF